MKRNHRTSRPTSPRVTSWGAFDTALVVAIAALIVAITVTIAQRVTQASAQAAELANTHCPPWNHVEWAQVGGRWVPAHRWESGGDKIRVGARWIPICSESVTATVGSQR